MAEIWDLYDAERRRTGKTMMRGEPVPRGFYTLSVSVWLTNGRGEYLLSKRHPAKKFPNLWECTGGGALAGEESIEAPACARCAKNWESSCGPGRAG